MTHKFLLGGSPSCDFLGTTTIGHTHGETLPTIMLALSSSFNPVLTHAAISMVMYKAFVT